MRSVQIVRKSSITSLNSDESEKVFEQIVKKSTKPEKPLFKPVNPYTNEEIKTIYDKVYDESASNLNAINVKQNIIQSKTKSDTQFFSIEDRIRIRFSIFFLVHK